MQGLKVLVPMAGDGRRFRDKGYKQIKGLIPVLGKTMIVRVLESLGLCANDRIWIGVREEDEAEYKIVDKVRNGLNRPINVVRIIGKTKGCADTIQRMIRQINECGPWVTVDCDTIYSWHILDDIRKHDWSSNGGVVSFKEKCGRSCYSFLQLQEHTNTITYIQEKRRISHWACSGMYIVGPEFTSTTHDVLKTVASGQEVYMSNVIDTLIRKGHIYKAVIARDEIWCVGTPEQLCKTVVQPRVISKLCQNTTLIIHLDMIRPDIISTLEKLCSLGFEIHVSLKTESNPTRFTKASAAQLDCATQCGALFSVCEDARRSIGY